MMIGPVVNLLEVPPSELRFRTSSGRVSLDLVATIGERWRRRFERLRGPEDLDRWCSTVGLPAAAAATPGDLQDVRTLRAAIEALAVAAMEGRAYPEPAVTTVNDQAVRPDLAPWLTDEGSELRPGSHDRVRSTVARDAVDLFGGPFARKVRECSADDCALVYVDTTRGGTRRWCSMQACGNRTKVARHRGGPRTGREDGR
ncbi:MAG: CGNR zinc finger domain-containing protein [Actinobacteria bacterium]|nr:CGNR zinc finger domain-containing protein [Actinomycetota bacterium]